jgi:hypothetical protein
MRIMLIIMRKRERSELVAHETIFPRPTPWSIFFKAWGSMLSRRYGYRFVFFPSWNMNLMRYDIMADGNDVILSVDGEEIYRTPAMPMDLTLWAMFMVESIGKGLFTRIWMWRWRSGKMSLPEMQAQIDRLNAYIQRIEHVAD